ncbi:hypothetical protein [Psychrobacillus sp. FJAT-21963]|uniref:hypothetical protein n=1 Tax=Psychrobacillus sp. FJAT-21963 TaxID=1712028 RepID=UPI000AED9905|nr:hypothetical protein [Psychrobacillus sp. FJAT-21963]
MENQQLKNLLYEINDYHYKTLDKFSLYLCHEFEKSNNITSKVIQAIVDLYHAASINLSETIIDKDNKIKGQFKSSYHPAVTADFEYLIARFLYHIGNMYEKGWSVDLRKQVKNAAPDIRISKNGETLWILELKVSMSWSKSFVSPTFYDKAKEDFVNRKKDWDPDIFNQKQSNTLDKYSAVFNIPKEKIYFVTPSLATIHDRNPKLTIDKYRSHFKKVSGLPSDNFVVFNENLFQKLNVSEEADLPFIATNNLEEMLMKFIEN